MFKVNEKGIIYTYSHTYVPLLMGRRVRTPQPLSLVRNSWNRAVKPCCTTLLRQVIRLHEQPWLHSNNIGGSVNIPQKWEHSIKCTSKKQEWPAITTKTYCHISEDGISELYGFVRSLCITHLHSWSQAEAALDHHTNIGDWSCHTGSLQRNTRPGICRTEVRWWCGPQRYWRWNNSHSHTQNQ